MTVTWLTTIADIVNIVVIVKNIESNYSVVVGPNERTVTVEVVDPAPYNVTVVVFDICKNNYSSIPEAVRVHVESSSASLSGTILQSTLSPSPTFEKTTSQSHFPTSRSRHTISSPYMSSLFTPTPSNPCNLEKKRLEKECNMEIKRLEKKCKLEKKCMSCSSHVIIAYSCFIQPQIMKQSLH